MTDAQAVDLAHWQAVTEPQLARLVEQALGSGIETTPGLEADGGPTLTGMLAPSVLVSSGERFVSWVEEQYPQSRWLVETPISGLRSAGCNWNGTIDLLLRLPDGNVVMIDHKSAPLRREHCKAKANQYTQETNRPRVDRQSCIEASASRRELCNNKYSVQFKSLNRRLIDIPHKGCFAILMPEF